MLYVLMPVIFFLGIILIALEESIKINKAATAVGMCILLWGILLIGGTTIFSSHPEHFSASSSGLPFAEQVNNFLNVAIIEHLGDVATTLFFVLASMVIIDLIDAHGGFNILAKHLNIKSKRRMLWVISMVTFFMSALIGNLATVIVLITMLRKLVGDHKDRLIYACMLIIAANAGGSFSPIGDVTTLLLWTGKNISAVHQVSHVFPASLTMLMVSLIAVTFMFPKGAKLKGVQVNSVNIQPANGKATYTVFIIGIVSLVLVPVLQSIWGIPPFLVVLAGLTLLWCYTDIVYHKQCKKTIASPRVTDAFTRIEMSTILFFLGILMSVAALRIAGQLGDMAEFLNEHVGNSQAISFILGICSSFLDNVALVAGAIGMYPTAESGAFMTDGNFWTFLAYCAVTGGSILIIGSASGVTVMGMEKISFMYYLKRFSLIALVAYVAGAAVYTFL